MKEKKEKKKKTKEKAVHKKEEKELEPQYYRSVTGDQTQIGRAHV